MQRRTESLDQRCLARLRKTDSRATTRTQVPTAVLAAAVAVLSISPDCRADRLYGYADEHGVFNFSDVPSTPRHRLILEIRPTRAASGLVATRKPETIRHHDPGRLSALIHDVARQSRVEPALIEAVALVESNFDQHARSPKGAMGLMQLMPATAARFGISDPFDPHQNLLGGARYLRELIDRFDSLPLALAAYNAGARAVERHGYTIPPFDETVAYVPRVLNHYDVFRQAPMIGAVEKPPPTKFPRPKATCC